MQLQEYCMAYLKEVIDFTVATPFLVKGLQVIYIKGNQARTHDSDLELTLGMVLTPPQGTTLEMVDHQARIKNRLMVMYQDTVHYATSRVESLSKNSDGEYYLATQNVNFKLILEVPPKLPLLKRAWKRWIALG